MSRPRTPLSAIRASALLVALFALAVPAAAQSADILTGLVVGSDGRPVAGARVEALSLELETTRSTMTGENGRYMIMFPDGGGVYLLRITHFGMADQVMTVMREGGEELIMANLTLSPEPVALEGLTVQVRGGTPGQGQAGEQAIDLTQDMLNRLPLQDMDPATLALLSAGVIATSVDSITGAMGFSVAGMSDLLNQVTLDGIVLGEGGLGVPEEGVRRTQVSTSTFDVSQGGFAGGQVNMTTARGTNRSGGALSYRFDDDALQMNSAATTNGFRRQNVGGSWGGPLVQNKLFYNVSVQLQQNRNHRFALTADDPLAALRTGVSADSVARFLDILEHRYSIPSLGKTGPYDQVSSDIRVGGRLDWNMVQSSTGSHTLSTRFNVNRAGQDSTRISALDLSERGGETDRNANLLAMTLNSRFRTSWTNAFSVSLGQSWNEAVPFTEMPEGRVRITSEWEDGTRDTRTVVFGGNRSMPSEASSRDFQLSNDLSFLQPIGGHVHRFKVGGRVERQASESRSTNNLFGSYSYTSLAAFEANRPDRFERSLAERETSTSRTSVGLFLGDTWRISQPLEVTLGLRWDYSSLDDWPANNPAVEAAFGRRTDLRPSAATISPRIGFSYRLPDREGAVVLGPGLARSLTGGIGLFAGRAPVQVFSQAYRQTGLSEAEQRLICIGAAVPIPDWNGYATTPGDIPEFCADGGSGVPPTFSTRAPDVTLLSPDQQLPSSLRLELGYRTQALQRLPVNVRYTYSRGLGLWGYRDLNLDEDRFFALGEEGRPFFGDADGISAPSGATTVAGSRRDDEFSNVFEVISDLASSSHQLSTQAFGALGERTTIMGSYTLGFARDQGSAGGGRGGAGGMGLPPTAGNPNVREWAVSSADRRHTLNLVVSHAFRPELEVSLISRLSSGSPFTPMVDRDVNGDGMRNDRAFVFDPAAAADPAVAEGMQRLLAHAPARVVDCLETQIGQIADRNSCRNPWTQSLDLRASIRPSLPGVERRLTVSVDAANLLTGLDQVFHGRDNMKGWGDGARAEPTLLHVRGFDPATNAFRYEVNEAFGQARRGQNAQRAPFAVRISARIALGGRAAMNNRGFGNTGRMPGMGGMRGMGGMGGGRGAALDRGAMGAVVQSPVIGMILRGERPEPGQILDALTPNPVRAVLAMADTLALSETQAVALEEVAADLDTRLAPRREALAPAVDELLRIAEGFTAGRPDLAAIQPLQTLLQTRVQPETAAAREDAVAAMEHVRDTLTEEQWEMLPAPVRAGGVLGGGPGQGQRVRPEGAEGRPGAPGEGAGRRVALNPVATLDRMLANPIPIVLELGDALGLSAAQTAQVEAISAELDRALRARRAELGRRFDDVSGMEQIEVLRDIQPQITEGREGIVRALRQVQEILSDAQWRQVPEQIRSFQAQVGGRGRGTP
jgi:hypothetical protein